MKFVFTIVNGEVKTISKVEEDDVVVVVEDMIPTLQPKEGCKPILKHNEEEGVHWEYVPIGEDSDA